MKTPFDLTDNFNERLARLRKPDPQLVAANMAKLKAAEEKVAYRKTGATPVIPFGENGEITGKQLKEFMSAQGFSPADLLVRFFDPKRASHAISFGTDRDGDKHHDHGMGDTDLAMAEHGLVPCSFN